MTRRIITTLATLTACLAGAVLPATASALDTRPCRSDAEFVCGSLRVPLDQAGRAKGKLTLQVAAQRAYPKGAPLLVALSGGPGQSSVAAAASFAEALSPLLHRYRLAVIDQRGTGATALQCPELQRLGALDPYSAQQVQRCAQRVGAQHQYYSTADSVADLEALRRSFGAPKLALMGISYGTWVAQEYARAYPKRVDRLILDSVVGPQPNDGFFIDSYRVLPRILREQCAGSRCKGATKHPVADLSAVAARLRKGPIRGTGYSASGRAQQATLASEEQLSYLVTLGDLNPFLQARLPGALAAASEGDHAPLLRLRAIADGRPPLARDFSAGLNIITGCLDAVLPFSLTTAAADRLGLVQAALKGVPSADYVPWSAASLWRSGFADDCRLFPRQTNPRPPVLPLPDVPAMILSGRLDMRTPAESGRATAALLPRARVVEVRGNGHDQVDTDATGCVARALKRWIDRKAVGDPCRGRSNQVDVMPQPPRSVTEFKASRQVPGARGRTLLAVIDTAGEVRFSALEAAFGGLDPRGGGLRGGSYEASDAFEGTVRLRHYEYVPGVRVSGTLRLGFNSVTGSVRVAGAVSGRLRVNTSGGASGVLNGRTVRFRRSPATASAWQGGALRVPGAPRSRAAAERRLSRLGLR